MRWYIHKVFVKLHAGLALGTLAGLFWHVLQTTSVGRIPVFVTCGIWAASILLWFTRQQFFSTKATVLSTSADGVICLNLKNGVRLFPGCYFYVFLPGRYLKYDFFQSYPVMVLWYKMNKPITSDNNVSGNDVADREDVTLLVSRQGRLGKLQLHENENIILDGPYGQDPGLGQYEVVILMAKGIGIAGVLSSALNLFERQQHDSVVTSQMSEKETTQGQGSQLFRDVTRQIAILWIGEDVSRKPGLQNTWESSRN